MAQPAKLSQDRIVREAIAQMADGGLASVSLRNVAARLGARAPSLARHVGDKQRLLALMSAALFCDALDSVETGLAGHGWLRAFGHALRRKQAEIPDISALIAQAQPIADIDRKVSEKLAGQMSAAGLHHETAQTMQQAIQALVTGWMVFEHSPRRDELSLQRLADDRFAQSLDALIAGFAPDEAGEAD